MKEKTENQKRQEETKPEKKEKKKKGGLVFPIGITILSLICFPYIYYTTLIYEYGQANKPEGYYWPEYKDMWMTVVGAIVCQVVRKIIYIIFMPMALKIAKV